MPDLETREELLSALDSERAALLAVLPRFRSEQWYDTRRADGWSAHDVTIHLADANYGLALMAEGKLQPVLPFNPAIGWMDGLAEYNEDRRQKNATLSYDKVLERSAKALEQVRRSLLAIDDLDAPGPFGPVYSKRQWFLRIINHTREHRQELEQMLEQPVGR